MQMLSEMVRMLEKQHEEPEQKEPLSEVRRIWEKVMDQVDGLTVNFEKVVSDYLKSYPRRVKISKYGQHHKDQKVCGGLEHIQVEIAPIDGRPIDLVVYECKVCKYIAAWYVVFNEQINMHYKRDLLNI